MKISKIDLQIRISFIKGYNGENKIKVKFKENNKVDLKINNDEYNDITFNKAFKLLEPLSLGATANREKILKDYKEETKRNKKELECILNK